MDRMITLKVALQWIHFPQPFRILITICQMINCLHLKLLSPTHEEQTIIRATCFVLGKTLWLSIGWEECASDATSTLKRNTGKGVT